MAGVRSKPTKGGLYQAFYTDWTGKRRYLTEESEKKALKAAMAIEKDHDEIRKGYRPAPNSAAQHRKDAFADVVIEYLEWGQSQGGRKGRPWSEQHRVQRRRQLSWWEDQLGLSMLGDFDGVLPRAEKALRGLLEIGRAGKTVANYAEGLSAFCDWCVQRGYLDVDPLKGLAPFDMTPQVLRRSMTPKGKLDFHACRVAFINLILDQSEVTPKEAQELARHSSLDLTMNVYGRVREGRLAEAVERAGAAILQQKRVPGVYRMAAGAERENATSVKSGSCVSQRLVAGAGFEPATFGL